jgi:hypothetical protein
MSINKSIYRILLTLVLGVVLTVGCINVQVQQLGRKAQDVQNKLYTPEDAVLLDQVSDTGHKEFVAPNCMIASVKSAYGVNRSLASVINEYYDKLTQEDWELNPLYDSQKTNEHMFLSSSPQLALTIYPISDPGSFPLEVEKSKIAQFTTIYVVDLTYSEPSSLECSV